jgi:hypothetical protein
MITTMVRGLLIAAALAVSPVVTAQDASVSKSPFDGTKPPPPPSYLPDGRNIQGWSSAGGPRGLPESEEQRRVRLELQKEEQARQAELRNSRDAQRLRERARRQGDGRAITSAPTPSAGAVGYERVSGGPSGGGQRFPADPGGAATGEARAASNRFLSAAAGQRDGKPGTNAAQATGTAYNAAPRPAPAGPSSPASPERLRQLEADARTLSPPKALRDDELLGEVERVRGELSDDAARRVTTHDTVANEERLNALLWELRERIRADDAQRADRPWWSRTADPSDARIPDAASVIAEGDTVRVMGEDYINIGGSFYLLPNQFRMEDPAFIVRSVGPKWRGDHRTGKGGFEVTLEGKGLSHTLFFERDRIDWDGKRAGEFQNERRQIGGCTVLVPTRITPLSSPDVWRKILLVDGANQQQVAAIEGLFAAVTAPLNYFGYGRLPSLGPLPAASAPARVGAAGAWTGQARRLPIDFHENAFREIEKAVRLGPFDELVEGGTVARTVVGKRSVFGVNSSQQEGTLELRRQLFQWLKSEPEFTALRDLGRARALSDAEFHALLRAHRAAGGKLPKSLVMHVNRPTCNFCRDLLPAVLRRLEVDELTIYYKVKEGVKQLIATPKGAIDRGVVSPLK